MKTLSKADIYMKESIENIFNNGFEDVNPRPHYKDGTPAHTISVNHVIRSYDLSKGEFPICTLRPIAWKTAIKEILWIYQDASNDLELLRTKYGINYWDDWESNDIPGTIGTRYGEVVKRYDLMNKLLNDIKDDPYGRRHIMDLYQYKEMNETDGLNPCAFLTIWNVSKRNNEEFLDMCLIQRSGDMLTASGAGGINEVQYAALLIMVAKHTGFLPGKFTHFIANEQIYSRHMYQAHKMLQRYSDINKEILSIKQFVTINNPPIYPNLILKDKGDFYSITIDDFEMTNYEPIQPQLKLELGI